VRAGHGLRRERADDLTRAQFMRGIAHRKISRDGERFDPLSVFAHRARDRRLVEHLSFFAGGAVAALDANHRAAAVPLETRPLHHGVVEPDHQRADRAEAAFDHRVGGEGGGYGDETDVVAAVP